jgi:hypothetical protein
MCPSIKGLIKMKFSAFLLFGVFILYSCHDETRIMEKENTPELFSTWNWQISTGGIAGISYTPESTGEQIKIEFSPDFMYREYVNGQLVFETEFQITRAESIYQTEPAWVIKYNDRSVNQSYEIRDNNSLTLFDEVYDGFVHEYKKFPH